MPTYRLILRVVVSLVVMLSLAVGVQAQSSSSATDQSTPSALAKGSHPLGSYGGSDFDLVNLFNGNLSLSFPLASLGGRNGMSTAVTLSYNSKLWKMGKIDVDGDGRDDFLPLYDEPDISLPQFAVGWTIHAGRLRGRHTAFGTLKCGPPQSGTTYSTLTTLAFTAPDGTEYEFRDDLTDGKPFVITTCPMVVSSRGTKFHSVDGTAATFISDTEIFDSTSSVGQTSLSGTVILRNGTRFKIVTGRVVKQQDSNGNIIRYDYDGSGRLSVITDTMGRKIEIQYYEQGSPLLASVRVNGIGGVVREIKVERAKLGTVLRTNQSLKTLKELFPDPRIYQFIVEDKFNPTVVSRVVLPSGHSWEFQYNSYAEIARVKTPAGGAIEYDAPDGGVITRIGPEIFRRIVERRVYPNANSSVLEGRTVYSDPTTKDAQGYAVVLEQHYDGNGGALLAQTRHRFEGSPLDNYGRGYGVPTFTGYKPWLEGKELRTVEFETDGVTEKRVTEYFWEQRAAVSWVTTDKALLAQPENDPRLVRTQITLKESNQVSKTENDYDQYNNVIAERVFDYGIGAPGVKLREINRSYISLLNGKNYQTDNSIHIRSLVDLEIIKDGNNVIETKTRYEYDGYNGGGFQATLLEPIFVTSVAETRNPNYHAGWLWRGNVTKVTRGLDSAEASSTYNQYDIAGNVIRTIGPRANLGNIDLHSLVINYSASSHYAFPIQTTEKVMETDGSVQELTVMKSYDFDTGALLSSTGYNGEVTSYIYNDVLDRLTAEIRPNGFGETLYSYSPAGAYPTWVKVDVKQQASNYISTTSYFDGLLKQTEQRRSDVGGVVIVETSYDGLGRANLISNPYRTTLEDTYGWTRTNFDGLGRVKRVASYTNKTQTAGFSGEVLSQYAGTTVTVTDQQGKQRKSVSDALGRLREVWEANSTGGLTLLTSYAYDGRSNLRQVIQGGQTRSFTYDALSRLKQASSPENGTISYEYDSASNLISRTDARGGVEGRVNYSYDELNRVRTKSYPNSAINANVSYYYDNSAVPSIPIGFSRGNALGRLVAVVSDPVTQTGQGRLGYFNGYDIGGRITRSAQLLDGVAYESTTAYNELSQPISHTYPSGTIVTTSYNNSGQISTVSRNGQLITSTTNSSYNAAGALVQEQLGNQLYHNISYNSRLQPKRISLGTTNNAIDKLSLEYDYGLWLESSGPDAALDQTKNNGNLGRITITPGISTTPIKQNFAYDELNRIKLAREYYNGVASWSQSFIYDRYGNRSCCTPALGTGTGTSIQISQSTNRITNAGFDYDLAGNLTIEPTLSKVYNYDAENRLIKAKQQGIEVGKYYYDGNGWRVKAITAQGSRSMVYDASGRLIAEYTTNTAANAPSKEYVYRGAELISVVETAPPEMPPNITALTPNSGVQATSFSLKIDGSNLANAQEIIFTPNTGITVSGLTSTANSVTAT
ncbi:MAG: hypothetical protein AB1489_30950, partial [Acidobacteriota bacterium]